MLIKVSEATNVQLDWLVAKCEGGFDLGQRQDWYNKPWLFFFRDDKDLERVDRVYLNKYEPSTDWNQGGPIIEREQIIYDFHQSYPSGADDKVHARLSRAKLMPDRTANWYAPKKGPTILVAAMRCYVVSKLGDNVEIPKELK